ncbi:MAG: hypothetical protein ACI9NY_002451 [Kiritimatiellia bacterium]
MGALLLLIAMTSVCVAQDKHKGFYLGAGAGQADHKQKRKYEINLLAGIEWSSFNGDRLRSRTLQAS